MSDYEIRYLNQSGSLGMLYATSCVNDAQAKSVATTMFTDQYASYEIWQAMRLVEKENRRDPADKAVA